MRKPTARRSAVNVFAITLVTFVLGVTVAVFVAGAASASSPLTTTSSSSASSPTSTTSTTFGTDPNSPDALFSVINGTVNAASDHVIVGSSAFPNYTTGAVDNYYAMAHAHVDNSPFAEGTASPADTGPIGQTAAAGNFQQTQYADARWPGGPDTASYGSQGGPFATADAGEFKATADASEATNRLVGPGLAVPKGFDTRLTQALDAWKAKWLGPLTGKKPSVPTVKTPKAPSVTTPTATVTTPVGTVTTPTVPGVPPTPAVPVPVPAPSVPAVGAAGAPRSVASASTPPSVPGAPKLPSVPSTSSGPTSADGESLLQSSTQTALVPATGTTKSDKAKAYTLVTTGESSLGRVTLGGGQIVIKGIHVTASIANDGSTGTPTYKANVSIADASIAGVPVTIDESGVHVAGQGQGLPYQQASDGLNNALKQAGIKLFLVKPEVTSCPQTAPDTGTGTTTTDTTTTTTTTTTTSSDQSGTPNPCDQGGGGMCATGSDSGGGTGPGGLPGGVPAPPTTTTTSGDQSGTTTAPSGCDQTSDPCASTGTATGGGSSTGGVPGLGTTTTSKTTTTTSTTTTGDQSGMPSSCGSSGAPALTGACAGTATAPGTTTGSSPSDQPGSAVTPSTAPIAGTGTGTMSPGEEAVTATGVHMVFNQQASPSGVPSQSVEHILGEVFVDSLATLAPPVPPVTAGGLGLSSSSTKAKTCLGGRHRSGKATSGAAGGASAAGGGSTGGGSSLAGGSTSSGSGALSPSGSTLGASSQPGSSPAGIASLPARFAAALKKPVWLLVAYVLWQALVVGTGVSLWNWRRGGAL